jgi:tRNA-uridine 2-sulfurtransferase
LRSKRPEIFREGEIVDVTGKVVGEHRGLPAFTVGQRRGIKLSRERPLYVLELKPAENRVVVGSADDLLTCNVSVGELFWACGEPDGPIRVAAKIRYNMEPQRATLHAGNPATLVFDRPVRAVTPGQIAVAYRGQTVFAGGTILGSDSRIAL